MSRLVMKFGGTSVADVERIRNVAAHVKREVEAGAEVAVVVSAMAGKTNELVAWCKEAGSHFDNPEYDAVVASGELVTAGLLALVLKDMGLKARSWAGWQIPLITDDAHGSARIEKIDGRNLVEGFQCGEIAVVAGFQGLHASTNRVTTLGRGGSDTSAVALAAAIGADRCDIYTDVDGVYTTDPRVVPRARRLDKVSFEEMLEMASLGAKVLQERSVEVALMHKVRLYVRSSFDDPAASKARHAHLRRGGHRGTADRHRHRLLARRGADHAARGRRQAGSRGRDLRAAGGRQHQCRHDHPGRLRRHHDDRHHLHRAGVRI